MRLPVINIERIKGGREVTFKWRHDTRVSHYISWTQATPSTGRTPVSLDLPKRTRSDSCKKIHVTGQCVNSTDQHAPPPPLLSPSSTLSTSLTGLESPPPHLNRHSPITYPTLYHIPTPPFHLALLMMYTYPLTPPPAALVASPLDLFLISHLNVTSPP